MNNTKFSQYTITLNLDKEITKIIMKQYGNYKNFSINEINFKVKHPFYLNNLNTEKDLLKSFNNIKNEINIPNNVNFKKISYKLNISNNNLILEINQNLDLSYFYNQIIRRFDEFRKTPSPNEFKNKLNIFKNLSEIELINYQIWGYPYIFNKNNSCILISKLSDLKLNDFEIIKDNLYILPNSCKFLNLSKITLFKKDSSNTIFSEIAFIHL